MAGSSIAGNPLDAIQSVFIAPYWLLKNGHNTDIPETISPRIKHTGISKMEYLDGYLPDNQKLLTYPYCYFLISNGQGSSAVLKQELWEKTHVSIPNEANEPVVPVGDVVLDICGSLTPGCSIRAIPKNYCEDEMASTYGINLGKFPQINWNSDAFTNWLTQNGVNVAGQFAGTAFGLATGNYALSAGTLVNGLAIMKEGYEVSQQPPQNHGNINNGDIMLALDENCFHIFKMSIRYEWAERIDRFFTKYGYRVNKLKVPNVTGRPIFNYIQIASDEDVGFGSIPSNYFKIINDACRKGVTIWHNHNNIGDYTLNNRE